MLITFLELSEKRICFPKISCIEFTSRNSDYTSLVLINTFVTFIYLYIVLYNYLADIKQIIE